MGQMYSGEVELYYPEQDDLTDSQAREALEILAEVEILKEGYRTAS